MKIFKSIVIAAVCLLPTASVAQIRYHNKILNINGATEVGGTRIYVHDTSGLNWTCKSSNFFKLDVTPSNPRIYGSGDQVVFYNTETSTYNNIRVASVYQQSDARSKQDISPLKSGLSTLVQLKPVSYRWKAPETSAPLAKKASAKGDSVQVSYGPANESGLQLGFLAQDVAQVMPEIVNTDENGNMMVNYTAMIPLLVESVKELQQSVVELNQTVEAQSMVIEQLSGNAAAKAAKNTAKIISCTPNPTSGYVTITVEMADNVEKASLVISSIAGNREKSASISAEEQSVSLDLSMLKPGIHLVSLYVNNQLVDSCRLVKE